MSGNEEDDDTPNSTDPAGMPAQVSRIRLALIFVAGLWFRTGAGYHFAFFTRINPAAWLFGSPASRAAMLITGRQLLEHPGPTTIVTLGWLCLLSAPAYLLIIPSIWAIIGLFGAFQFGITQDYAMPLAAILALVVYLQPRSGASAWTQSFLSQP